MSGLERHAVGHDRLSAAVAQQAPNGLAGLEKEFELRWRMGARTAALIVQIANRFASEISISFGAQEADAKSIMDLFALESEAHQQELAEALARGAPSDEISRINHGSGLAAGSRIRVAVRGADARRAMDDMVALLSCGWRVTRCPRDGCSSAPALVGYTEDTLTYSCYDGHTWAVHNDREDFGRVAPRD